ncbi:helix-turn-helix transcriptional regulator [Muricauda sp. CAU 1633]|uniref:helix-turn-helix domain-containing protein n=1 Tax=Allomuricauda sp. CAU 1633 TaxID=2816036 RepID=UPI001A8D8555|nr:helix-turn-helix transcriptional regulator [Muricauda sp. CAU 1633]MBO0322161.1 helix-turn-helix transcriptional regulator [Muricauda sp. CAU 1633]
MHDSLDEIERYIISQVRDIREAKRITQEELSLAIGKNIGFISQIEAPSKKAKYNIVHLNLIATALNCSPKDFWPEKSILEEKYRNIKAANPKGTIN